MPQTVENKIISKYKILFMILYLVTIFSGYGGVVLGNLRVLEAKTVLKPVNRIWNIGNTAFHATRFRGDEMDAIEGRY